MEAIFCSTHHTMSRAEEGMEGQRSRGMVEVLERGQAGLNER